MKRFLLIIILLTCCSFTYRDIATGKLAQKSIAGLRPMADGERYSVVDSLGIRALRYDGAGEAELIFDGEKLEFFDYQFSNDEQKILLATNRKAIYRRSFTADYHVFDRRTGALTPLTAKGGEQQAAFSPDGTKVGFVRENNLYVVDLKDFSIYQITSDGERNRIINGLPDWVYEEEYTLTRAFAFSPDGGRIAWLRFDESAVNEFTIMQFGGRLYPEPYTFKYPKAGEANALVTLHTRDLSGGATISVDTGTEECYLPRIGFTPEGELYFFRVNRLQNRFEVLLAAADGSARTIYSESNEHYVERPDDQTVTFLDKGRFVVRNETTGRMHLYLYEGGRLKNAITAGDWDVARLVAIEGDRVWYLSTEGSPLRRHLYRVGLDGRRKTRITDREGTYSISPGKGMRYFVSHFSNAATPLEITIHRADGRAVRTLENNALLAAHAREIGLPQKQFFTCPAADGTPLNGYMIRPTDFDSTKIYPVLMSQYSGPGSQEVLDRWALDWEDVVVQHGYVVVCVDGRGTGMRGEAFKKCTYGRLGQIEVDDQLAAARWVAAQPWADPARIGIYGWSYGGFMALGCILHPDSPWKMAIAVAPVTSWRFYDSIYTEIYNGLPQDNPSGYDDFAPVGMAEGLRGKLLLVHGTGDDNVHAQNTLEMARALVRAGKQFDMALYPDDNHSMVPSGRIHIRERMIEYTLNNL